LLFEAVQMQTCPEQKTRYSKVPNLVLKFAVVVKSPTNKKVRVMRVKVLPVLLNSWAAVPLFGPKPRSYEYKIPKQQRKSALISALSQKASEGTMAVFKNLKLLNLKPNKVQVLGRLRKWNNLGC
jgi:hypothetical protein